jgi:hypothetical protein
VHTAADPPGKQAKNINTAEIGQVKFSSAAAAAQVFAVMSTNPFDNVFGGGMVAKEKMSYAAECLSVTHRAQHVSGQLYTTTAGMDDRTLAIRVGRDEVGLPLVRVAAAFGEASLEVMIRVP